MLVIRPEQMEALRTARLQQFEDLAIRHLKETFPNRFSGETEADIRSSVRHGTARALAYGLETEIHILRFLRVMFVLGPDFDERLDWAREILADPETGPESKTEELLDRTSSPEGD